MALSKKPKIWVVALLSPMVLVVVAVAGLKLYFTSDRLKAMVIPRVEENIHRSVDVREISLSFFPSIGVSLEGVTISNPRGMEFSRSEFISLEELTLNVKLLPLLSSRVEVTKISLRKPSIYLETREDGKKNYKSTPTAIVADTTASAPGSSQQFVLLANLEISEGRLEQLNRRYDSRVIIDGWNQSARVEPGKTGNRMLISYDTDIASFSYGSLSSLFLSGLPLTSEGKLSLDIDSFVLTIDEAKASLKDLPMQVSGSISNLRDEPRMDLSLSSPDLQMEQLLSLVPPEFLKAAEGMESAGDVDLTIDVKGPVSDTVNPGVKGAFKVERGSIRYASLPKTVSDIMIRGSFDIPVAHVEKKDIGTFDIDTLAAKLGTTGFHGRLHVSNFDKPVVSASFNGTINLGEVKEYYPLEEGTSVAGMMKASIALSGPVKSPSSLKADGTIDFQQVTIASANSPKPLRNLNGTISFNNEIIESKRLSMEIGESDLSMSMRMKNYLGLVLQDTMTTLVPSATMTVTSKQIRTEDLMSDAVESRRGNEPTGNSGEGMILPGMNVDADVSIGKLVTEKFEFADVKGKVSLADGMATLRNLSLQVFDGEIVSRGTLDLRNADRRPFDLDLDIRNVEANSLLSNFSSFGSHLSGKLNMKTKLDGELDDTLGINRATLVGDGAVDMADGRLKGFALTSKLAEATGLDELREVNFNDWSNSFTIENGKMKIPDLTLKSRSADFTAGGTQGLDGGMDYNLSVKLTPELSGRLSLQGVAGELLQFFKDDQGRMTLDFKVTGDVDSPALRLNTEAQQEKLRKAVGDKADEAKKKLEEELKKKAGEGLRKLLRKP